MSDATLIARAPRWCYVMGAFAAALVVALFARILAMEGLADGSLVATLAIMSLVSAWIFLSMAARSFDPPTVMQDDTGLVLSGGGRRRRWDWRSIDAIRMVGTGRGALIAIDWRPDGETRMRPDGETRMRSAWLTDPFSQSRAELADRLHAARANGSGRPPAVTLSPGDLRRTICRTRAFVGTLGAAGIVFMFWVIGNAAYPTALLTPIDPAWTRTGAIAGLVFGGLLPVTFVRATWTHGPGSMPPGRALAWTAVTAVFALSVFAMVGEAAARGLADTVTFSDPIVTTTQGWVRIRGWHSYRGSHYARVHPFAGGEQIDLPLSRAEYDRLADDRSDRWTYGYCYPATLDRTRTALRVHVPSPLPVNMVRPCTAAPSDIQ